MNHKHLITVLRNEGIPLPLVKWVASFLNKCQAAVCLDGIRGDMSEVQNGIPQGSPVSPILAAYYTSDLLNLFCSNPAQSTPVPDKPTPVTIFMYVDDGKLTVSSRSLETNIIYLKSAYNKVDEWLYQAGLSPDYMKRELMHYTRRRKDGSPSITFGDRDGERRVVSPQAHVRWLGVHFDRKLFFTHHIKLAAAKGANAVCSLSMLANTVRGLHQKQIRHLYISCVLPKMLYAAPIWANGKANQLKPLAKVQRRALILICAAFRTTSTEALEIEASLPPLHLRIKQLKMQYAIHFNRLPSSSPVLQRLSNNWRKGKKPKLPPPLPPKRFNNSTADNKRSTPLMELEKLTSPTHERSKPFHSPPWRKTASSFPNRVHIVPHSTPDTDTTPAQSHNTFLNEIKLSPQNVIALMELSLKCTKYRNFLPSGTS